MVLILVVLLVLLAVPVAYLLRYIGRAPVGGPGAGGEPRCSACRYSLKGLSADALCPECGGSTRVPDGRPPLVYERGRFGKRRAGSPPWCGGCGYSMAGLHGAAVCPECGGRPLPPGPWPKGWVVLAWCVLAHLPTLVPLLSLTHHMMDGQGGGGGDWSPLGWLVGLLSVPIGVSFWAAWVVSRRGTRWLSVSTLAVVAGVPMAIELAVLVTTGGRDHSQGMLMFPGLGELLMVAVCPVVTVGALALFSAFGLVTAGLLESLQRSRV